MESQVTSMNEYRLNDLSAFIASDFLKGSYYANPITDICTVSDELRQAYPEYYGANICMSSLSYTVRGC
jgi:hypothetical protein